MDDSSGIKRVKVAPTNYKKIIYKQEELLEESRNDKNKNWGEPYKLEEREKIEYYLNLGYSCTRIAKFINRSKNGVVHEVRRYGGKKNYSAINAQEKSEENNLKRISKLKISGEDKYLPFKERIKNLEMQIEIILDIIKQKG